MSKARELWEENDVGGDYLSLRDYAEALEQKLSDALSAQARAESERDDARRMVCRIPRSITGREYFDALMNSAFFYQERRLAQAHGWDPDVLFPLVKP